ncbi:hypothetical protein RND71_030674 [Anisodus tanguticus]|uniref:Uncharacterized protein n=1 Tax=Anisodus tanguticus TaxID=243964 RepID=A0AAE1RGI4_9SOLA|nr:hypothetical protein RND71_030674 [Anisodus tanguticus]
MVLFCRLRTPENFVKHVLLDIRRSIPGYLRPLMTNIPASSMYSVRSGPNSRSRTVSVSDSLLATSSNTSSEVKKSENTKA